MYALLCALRVLPSTTNRALSGKLREPAKDSIVSLHLQTRAPTSSSALFLVGAALVSVLSAGRHVQPV